ncbi:MAG: hypothetical protein GX624_01525 [Actinobacteria bacterium]|nr:hypothetical protein [Actinomycetota bacterium]
MHVRRSRRSGWRRLTPRAGARAQLVAAAVVWLVGTAILLVRGVAYIVAPDEYERFGLGIVLIALVGIAIGIVKARFVLIRYATRAVSRIRSRGHACFFGLFAWSSWVFIAVMMGGGLLLRHSPLVDSWWGRTFLGVLYVAVGTALAIADVVFWRAALGGLRETNPEDPPAAWGDPGADQVGERPPAEPVRRDRKTTV